MNYDENESHRVCPQEILNPSIKYSESVSPSFNFPSTLGQTRSQHTYITEAEVDGIVRGNDCILPSPFSKGATTRLFVKSSSPLSYHSCSKTCSCFPLIRDVMRNRDRREGPRVFETRFLCRGRFLHRVTTAAHLPALSQRHLRSIPLSRDMFAVMTSFTRGTWNLYGVKTARYMHRHDLCKFILSREEFETVVKQANKIRLHVCRLVNLSRISIISNNCSE